MTTTFKRSTRVTFRTRTDRPQLTGKVTRTRQTRQGAFIEIRGDDGVTRAVRPAYIEAVPA